MRADEVQYLIEILAEEAQLRVAEKEAILGNSERHSQRLSEDICSRGSTALAAQRRRITELLEANNRYLTEARAARAELKTLKERILGYRV